MKILLFGGNGQVGQELRLSAHELNLDLLAPISSEVDISDFNRVQKIVQKINPTVVVNCAAYNAVDLAEKERDLSFRINAEGAGNIAKCVLNSSAYMVHVSTDYVFAGDGKVPINENEQPSPISVYGASKLLGEQNVVNLLPERSLIVRTSSVHGRFGNNIVHTILKLLSERDQLQFVQDQIMSPTWAGWLAEVLMDLIKLETKGIVHAACAGAVSWFEFASEVLNIAKETRPGWSNKKVLPILVKDYPRPAKRPAYSVLDCSKLNEILGRPALDWKKGLRQHMLQIEGRTL